jgi:lantibiotic modifying enzyme
VVMLSQAEAAREALRWVTDAAVPVPGGLAWPETRQPDGRVSDDLYDGTAGVLMALAEARLSGITDFDAFAAGAVGRLSYLGGADPAGDGTPDPGDPANPPPDPRRAELYIGLAGYPVALRTWAAAAGDQAAATTAGETMAWLAGRVERGKPAAPYRDLIMGEAGILLALVTMDGGTGAYRAQAAGWIADRLVADAQWPDGQPGGPDWLMGGGYGAFQPNFSHGAAGIGFALATASGPLGRPELLDLAAAAGRRLERLGRRLDGTLTVPVTIPQRPLAEPATYGWCHGSAGTSRLFTLLEQLRPGEGWAGCAAASRAAIRASGLPARLWPGFWDNLGQCCGTAGVGEAALDHYQDTGDRDWLDFADVLAADVLARAITDADGVRWSHTEYRISPPELEPYVGWMQGAAGIAGFLLHLDRLHRDGPGAPRLTWPDRPPPAVPIRST